MSLFFNVKIIDMEMRGRKTGAIIKHTMHYRRVIISLQPGYSFSKKIWISECCYSGYIMYLNFNNCTALIKFCRLLFLFWLHIILHYSYFIILCLFMQY